jgi:hypothetical protein
MREHLDICVKCKEPTSIINSFKTNIRSSYKGKWIHYSCYAEILRHMSDSVYDKGEVKP